MILDERAREASAELRRYATERAAAVDFDQVRRIHRQHRLISGMAVVVIAVIALLTTVWLGGSSGPPVITQPPTPTPTIPTPVDSWNRVGQDVTAPPQSLGELWDVSVVGERLIATGSFKVPDMRADGAIFTSNDGVTWSRVGEDDEALTVGVALLYGGVLEGGPGLVAFGGGCVNPDDKDEPCHMLPTLWTSVEGSAWTRVPHDREVFGDAGSIEDAVSTRHGIVAVGNILHDPNPENLFLPAMWISPNGSDWSLAWEGEPGVEPSDDQIYLPSVYAVTVQPNGRLIAVGTRCDNQEGCVAAVWTSVDGSEWQRAPHDPGVFASESTVTDVVMMGVAANETGVVAVGGDGANGVVWFSPDGLAWSRLAIGDRVGNGPMSAVTAGDREFVAAGPTFPGAGTVWTSADGETWIETEQFGDHVAVVSLIEGGPGLIAVGSAPDFNSTGAIWITERTTEGAP